MDVPTLDPRGNAECGEGPANFQLYQPPKGRLKAVMIFVDFKDRPASETTKEVADILLGARSTDGAGESLTALERLYDDQSCGKLSLRVDARTELGWRRMSKSSNEYSFRPWQSQRDYIQEAANLFADEVRFSDFQFTYVVAPRDAGFFDSPAFTVFANDGARTKTGTIRLGVTVGTDMYKNGFINLVHETGHLLGLPDLYPGGGGAENSSAGCWGIMSDIFRATGFLGWHRHKNGWLDPGRMLYLTMADDAGTGEVSRQVTLAPFADGAGTSMVVLPIDSAARPSKVFVIEVAQPVRGFGTGRPGREGVLLYTVDAAIPSLQSPINVVPMHDGHDTELGNLFAAPMAVGDAMSHSANGAEVTVSVTGRAGSGYQVALRYSGPR